MKITSDCHFFLSAYVSAVLLPVLAITNNETLTSVTVSWSLEMAINGEINQ